MLVDMKVQNFLSYGDEEYFSMETGERLRKHNDTHTFFAGTTRLLKNAILFGANASGKTNLFAALARMRHMILAPTNKVGDRLDYSPCKVTDSEMKGTTFEISFYKGRLYNYSISYDKKKFLSEKLAYKKGNKFVTYFQRDETGYSVLPKELSQIAEETRENSLFLFNLQNKNDKFAEDVFRWFDSDLILFQNEIPDEYLENIENDTEAKSALLSFLAFADTNIIDIDINDDIRELTPNLKKFFEALGEDLDVRPIVEDGIVTKKLYTVYKKYNKQKKVTGRSKIGIRAESRGNRKLISIALTLVNNIGKGKVILIDEFDSALHLQLAKALVKIFNTKNNNNQFILSSHELQLLDCELRKDQIWLVEKDFTGLSHLYSIFDFSELSGSSRDDISFFSRYMKGQFGALPSIDYEGMMSALNCQKSDRNG
ncbi:ATP-binding protein [Enterococcus durans]|uniref:AAA family ATPase n=1 Tax=Enterococcus durans TaxID=53345 RepID=UPI0011BE09A0|nr:ATP-binding protein [Enterococcus durans]QED60856.1 ATP-binding protein [Enterococcus durans]QED63454.1 ATP-binding protein [Enterococcus durans]